MKNATMENYCQLSLYDHSVYNGYANLNTAQKFGKGTLKLFGPKPHLCF